MKSYSNFKLNRLIAVVIAAVYPFFSSAQFSRPDEKFTAGESFLYPINPGLPGSLSGTMGELRSTHFHTGLDIRTNNVIGLPVLASKSGYISRVSVGPTGYGNVIYITHPDGYTTIYAHLDRFKSDLADYVLKEHYRKSSSQVNLYFKPNQFPVKRGDTIAFSGNSGSSGGPHLHFDIRDKNNFALNPLLVEDFPEIKDELPPAVEKLALRTLDKDSRINDQFGRFEFHARRVGNNYVFDVPVLAHGNIGVEVLAKDRLAPGSRFHGGVNYIQLYVDSQLVFNQSIDKLNLAHSRQILTVLDFPAMRNDGNRFYKLFREDGNHLHFYNASPGDGKIRITEGDEKNVTVNLSDSYGNTSTLTFALRPSPPAPTVPLMEARRSEAEFQIHENTLKIITRPCPADSNRAILHTRLGQRIITPDYANKNAAVYLIDLRKEIPDSVVFCSATIRPGIAAAVPSRTRYDFYSDRLDIQFPAASLYDTLYLQTDHRITDDDREIFRIGSPLIPLNQNIQVTFRPAQKITWKPSLGVYLLGEKGPAYVGGKWENGAVRFATREFGEFTILEDTTPPIIQPVVVNDHVARFKIDDKMSGISSFRATINGQWLLMYHDPKTQSLWSERLDKNTLLKGEFTLVVTDNAGNRSTYNKTIQ